VNQVKGGAFKPIFNTTLKLEDVAS
jgi:hypothetical protein